MSATFKEIDRRPTPMGEISLRRRLEPSLEVDVYEVKLDDEFLMSSLFTVAEVALATLALAATPGDELDVVVGGLGLGHTARAVLDDSRVRSLVVIEALGAVIDWHNQHLVPLGWDLTSDRRCRFVEADFFARVADGSAGTDSSALSHAILVDIDHSPRRVLHPSHARFYEPKGLRQVASRLRPGGVFALWSDDPPDEGFMSTAAEVFDSCEPHVIRFPNFYTDGEAANTVYVAKVGR